MQDESNQRLSAPVSSPVIVVALVCATLFGGLVGYQLGTVFGTVGAWNQVSKLGSPEAKAAAQASGSYSHEVVVGCLQGVSTDPTIDCDAVLASLPDSKPGAGKPDEMSIASAQTIDASCPPPTSSENGKCVLASDVVLTQTLWLSSGTTLDCKGHRMTPSVDGQGSVYQPNRLGTFGFLPSTPSVPNTAVLLAGDTSGVTVKNCVIENFDFGVVIANSKLPNASKPESRNRIVNNTLNNRYRGVEIIAADGNEVSGNSINSFGSASGGVGIEHDSDDNLIKDNSYVGSQSDYWIPGPLFPGGKDEWTRAFLSEGVRVWGPTFSYNLTVGDKKFVGTQTPNNYAERNVIEDNDVYLPNLPSGDGYGIHNDAKTDGTIIRRNTVRGASGGVFSVNFSSFYGANAKNVRIENNTILDSAWAGILLGWTDDTIASGNKILGSGWAGVIVAERALWSATVSKNLVKQSQDGLVLFSDPGPQSFFGAKISLNDFIDNASNVYAWASRGAYDLPTDLSADGKGNFWGHTEAPAFRSTDTNEPSLVTDSHASLVPVSGPVVD